MNLEQIDTSTTAGKAEVMRLAAEGRKVAQRTFPNEAWIEQRSPAWAWPTVDYAIISKPVGQAGPKELWVIVENQAGVPLSVHRHKDQAGAYEAAYTSGTTAIRYIRADLAGGDA